MTWRTTIDLKCLKLFIFAAFLTVIHAAPLEQTGTDLGYYPVSDSTGCYYNFQHYDEGDRIFTNEPCLNCTCHNRMLMCYLRVCPFIKALGENCRVEKRADLCCPIITCPEVPVQLVSSNATQSSSTDIGHPDSYGCMIDGLFYGDGVRIPSDPSKPCELCYCIRNKTACVMQECTLKIQGCTPVYHRDVCCPIRYDCDHSQDNLLDGPDNTTPGLIFTTPRPSTTTSKLTTSCLYNGEWYADGAQMPKQRPCDSCYCMKGEIVCAVQECAPTPLDKVNCTALPVREGECCPHLYECSRMTDEPLVTTEIMNQEQQATTIADQMVDVTTTKTKDVKKEDASESLLPSENGNYITLPEKVETTPIAENQKIDETLSLTTEYSSKKSESPSVINEETTPNTILEDNKITTTASFESVSDDKESLNKETTLANKEIIHTETSSVSQPLEENETTTNNLKEMLSSHDDTSSSSESSSSLSNSDENLISENIKPLANQDTPMIVTTTGSILNENKLTTLISEEYISSNVGENISTESSSSESFDNIQTSPSSDKIENTESVTNSQENLINKETTTSQKELIQSTEKTDLNHLEEKITTNKPDLIETTEKLTEVYEKTTTTKSLDNEISNETEEKGTTAEIEPNKDFKETTTLSPIVLDDKEKPVEPETLQPVETLAEKDKETNTEPDHDVENPSNVEESHDKVTTVKSEPLDTSEVFTEKLATVSASSESTEKITEINTEKSEDISLSGNKEPVTTASSEVSEKATTALYEESEKATTALPEDSEKSTTVSFKESEKVTTASSGESEKATTAISKETEKATTASFEETEKATTALPEESEKVTTVINEPVNNAEKVSPLEDHEKATTIKTEEINENPSGEDQTIDKDSITTEKYVEPELTTLPISSEFTTKNIIKTTQESIEKTTQRIIPGEGSCLVDGITYKDGESIAPINQCQVSCLCVSSIVKCESVTCDPPPYGNLQNCLPVYQGPESCCPIYNCAVPEAPAMESGSHTKEESTKSPDILITTEQNLSSEEKLPESENVDKEHSTEILSDKNEVEQEPPKTPDEEKTPTIESTAPTETHQETTSHVEVVNEIQVTTTKPQELESSSDTSKTTNQGSTEKYATTIPEKTVTSEVNSEEYTTKTSIQEETEKIITEKNPNQGEVEETTKEITELTTEEIGDRLEGIVDDNSNNSEGETITESSNEHIVPESNDINTIKPIPENTSTDLPENQKEIKTTTASEKVEETSKVLESQTTPYLNEKIEITTDYASEITTQNNLIELNTETANKNNEVESLPSESESNAENKITTSAVNTISPSSTESQTILIVDDEKSTVSSINKDHTADINKVINTISDIIEKEQSTSISTSAPSAAEIDTTTAAFNQNIKENVPEITQDKTDTPQEIDVSTQSINKEEIMTEKPNLTTKPLDNDKTPDLTTEKSDNVNDDLSENDKITYQTTAKIDNTNDISSDNDKIPYPTTEQSEKTNDIPSDDDKTPYLTTEKSQNVDDVSSPNDNISVSSEASSIETTSKTPEVPKISPDFEEHAASTTEYIPKQTLPIEVSSSKPYPEMPAENLVTEENIITTELNEERTTKIIKTTPQSDSAEKTTTEIPKELFNKDNEESSEDAHISITEENLIKPLEHEKLPEQSEINTNTPEVIPQKVDEAANNVPTEENKVETTSPNNKPTTINSEIITEVVTESHITTQSFIEDLNKSELHTNEPVIPDKTTERDISAATTIIPIRNEPTVEETDPLANKEKLPSISDSDTTTQKLNEIESAENQSTQLPTKEYNEPNIPVSPTTDNINLLHQEGEKTTVPTANKINEYSTEQNINISTEKVTQQIDSELTTISNKNEINDLDKTYAPEEPEITTKLNIEVMDHKIEITTTEKIPPSEHVAYDTNEPITQDIGLIENIYSSTTDKPKELSESTTKTDSSTESMQLGEVTISDKVTKGSSAEENSKLTTPLNEILNTESSTQQEIGDVTTDSKYLISSSSSLPAINTDKSSTEIDISSQEQTTTNKISDEDVNQPENVDTKENIPTTAKPEEKITTISQWISENKPLQTSTTEVNEDLAGISQDHNDDDQNIINENEIKETKPDVTEQPKPEVTIINEDKELTTISSKHELTTQKIEEEIISTNKPSQQEVSDNENNLDNSPSATEKQPELSGEQETTEINKITTEGAKVELTTLPYKTNKPIDETTTSKILEDNKTEPSITMDHNIKDHISELEKVENSTEKKTEAPLIQSTESYVPSKTEVTDLPPFTSGPQKITEKPGKPGELSTSKATVSTSTEGFTDYEEPDINDYGENPDDAGPGTCRYGGKVYVSAQQIPRDDPCDFCFCFRSDIICLQQSCPPPIRNCIQEPIKGFCCPRYECPVNMALTYNLTTTTTTTTTTLPPHFLSHAYKGKAVRSGCMINQKTYQVGESIPSASGPCLECKCGGHGQMECNPVVCSPNPMLESMISMAESGKRRR